MLFRSYSFLELFLTRLMDRLVEQKGLCDRGKERGERIERLSHRVLEVVRGVLRPKQVAYEIGDHGAHEHNK